MTKPAFEQPAFDEQEEQSTQITQPETVNVVSLEDFIGSGYARGLASRAIRQAGVATPKGLQYSA